MTRTQAGPRSEKVAVSHGPVVAAALALLVACGCSGVATDDAATGSSSHLRDSAGVRIAEFGAASDAWELGDPILSIDGVTDSSDESLGVMEFSDVASARFVGLGSDLIAVASARDLSVAVFELDGSQVFRMGGAGQGPREFVGLVGVDAYRTDSILAFDPRRPGITVMGPDGGLGRAVQLHGIPSGVPPLRGLAGTLPDGRFVLYGFAEPPEREGYQRLSMVISVFAADGVYEAGLGEVPGLELFFTRVGDAVVWAEPPFHREGFVAIGGARLITADSDRLGFSVLDGSGQLQARIVVQRARRAVSRRAEEKVLESLVSRLPRGDPVREDVKRRLKDMIRHSTLPAIGELTVGRGGEVMLRHWSVPGDAGRDSVTVFAEDGTRLRTLVVPTNVRLLDIYRHHILASDKDALGRERVVLYRLPH